MCLCVYNIKVERGFLEGGKRSEWRREEDTRSNGIYMKSRQKEDGLRGDSLERYSWKTNKN